MGRRAKTNLLALLLLGALAAPPATLADSGGIGLPGGGTVPSTGGTLTVPPPGTVFPGNVTASATSNGLTVSTRISALLAHGLRFTGAAVGARRGSKVIIQRLDSRLGWVTTSTATVARRGRFSAVWRTNHTGRFTVRAYIQGARASRTRSTSGTPTLMVTVYKPAIATLFGEGSYGSTTACGLILRKNTLGTANRTLPCGTLIAVYWHGHSIIVPVIDRGPYANHADWDLTWATGAKLSMNSTETIGATPVQKSR